jgi:site-specific recombinase XerD
LTTNNSPLTKSEIEEVKEVKEEVKSKIIYRVTTGSLAPDTKRSYQNDINDFLEFYKITDVEIVKDWSPKLARQHLIDYVIYLRDIKRFPRGSINIHIAAINHFFYMIRDDATRLDMTKVRMELPPNEFLHRDRPYTVKEIQKMLSVCPRLREKAIILLLTSTGMRIGAIHELKLGDIQPKNTAEGKVYLITVYSSSSKPYQTPCSPECAAYIDEYLEERRSMADEVLKNDSPLIRNLYDIKKKAVKPLTKSGVQYAVERIIKKSGIKNTFQFKGEAKRALGFRKFYKTQAEESGMKSINVEIAHGHSIGVSGHYYRPKPSEILQDYMTHAADALTIDPTQRLEKENQELRKNQNDYLAELGELREEFNEMKQLFVHLRKDSQKEIFQMVEDKADIDWSCDD